MDSDRPRDFVRNLRYSQMPNRRGVRISDEGVSPREVSQDGVSHDGDGVVGCGPNFDKGPTIQKDFERKHIHFGVNI